MGRVYKAVIIGAAHMHSLYLARECLANPRVNLCGFADTVPLRDELAGSPPFTRKWNIEYINRLGVPFYKDFEEMLDATGPDFALVSTETPLHAVVFEACARRGIAVSVEKPMAVTYADGLKMARIAERTGALLMVNWPLAWQPFMGQYKELITSGKIGRLAKVHHLVGHPGPLGKGVRHPLVQETSDATTGAEKASTWWHTAAAGGGAMLDFCGYGVMACNYLVGQKAVAVTGMRCNTESLWGDADDNAAMLVRYPGCMAVLEGSWTVPNGGISPAPTLFGSEAMVSAQNAGGGVQVSIRDYFGHIELLPVLEPEPRLLNITTAYVHHRDTGEPLPSFLDLYENLEVMAILDAGVRSASSGKTEIVATRSWEIG